MERRNPERWLYKLVAFLHDPPDKASAIRGHEMRARALVERALGAPAPQEAWDRAKEADRLASAADRVDFPAGTEAYWTSRRAVLTHPLAGTALDLGHLGYHLAENKDLAPERLRERMLEAVEDLVQGQEDPRRRFLRLWRLLPERLAEKVPQVGALWGLLPAETRQPDHPLFRHLSVASALAPALPEPAFLVMSLGPVQGFIRTARRTQDLWMGSWLLSYLTWQALQAVAEEWGPDAVLFPVLYRQPLCDRWLAKEGVLEKGPPSWDLARPTLPNRFVALLPAGEAEEAGRKAEGAVLGEWERLAEGVHTALLRHLGRYGPPPGAWRDQARRLLEVYWAVFPWPGARQPPEGRAEAVLATARRLLGKTGVQVWEEVLQHYLVSGNYRPNWGTAYAPAYTVADRALTARKFTRLFSPGEEPGMKCSICGERSALALPGDGALGDPRRFWSVLEEALRQKGRYEVRPGGRERLCGVCAVKRFVQREVLKADLGLQEGFPSTSEVATAPFKRRVLERLRDDDREMADALRHYLDALKGLGLPETGPGREIRRLRDLAQSLPEGVREVGERFLDYDGEFLFQEQLTEGRVQEAGGRPDGTALEKARNALGGFLRVARERRIPPPTPYYAVLVMDGDEVGKWVSGTHPGLPRFGDILHPDVRADLQGRAGWAGLLDQPRLLTPSLHAFLSEAMACFALRVVPDIVQFLHTGRLVYAGGDDVLALLPAEEALEVARRLRAGYSGHLDEGWRVDWGRPSGFLVLRRGREKEVLPTMGARATASVGIALVHQQAPLDLALESARLAEERAKEHYGRDALAVAFLRRSGEETRVGTRWHYREQGLDPVDLVAELVERMQKGDISMRFAGLLMESAWVLAGLPREAREAEIRRLLLRRGESRPEGKAGLGEKEARGLAGRLVGWAEALGSHLPGKGDHTSGMEEVARWVRLARFLAQGGAG